MNWRYDSSAEAQTWTLALKDVPIADQNWTADTTASHVRRPGDPAPVAPPPAEPIEATPTPTPAPAPAPAGKPTTRVRIPKSNALTIIRVGNATIITDPAAGRRLNRCLRRASRRGGDAALRQPARRSAMTRLRTLLGIALIAGSIAVASIVIYDLTRIGSCASGGPYVIANPCPAGTGWKVLGLVASVFIVPFAGIGVLATRFRGTGVSPAKGGGLGATAVGIGGLWFFLLFTCMGAAALVAGTGPATPDSDGIRSASYWVAGTFLLIGGPALLVILVVLARGAPRKARL